MIAKKNGFKLYAPEHSQDMNYHLVDDENMIDYLIDICDVYDEEDEEFEEYGGLIWADLKSLNDIDEILIYAWRKLDMNTNQVLND